MTLRSRSSAESVAQVDIIGSTGAVRSSAWLSGVGAQVQVVLPAQSVADASVKEAATKRDAGRSMRGEFMSARGQAGEGAETSSVESGREPLSRTRLR